MGWWGYSQSDFVMEFWQTLGKTLDKPRVNLGQTSGKPWANLGQTLGKTLGKPQATPWASLRQPLGKPWANLGQTSGKPWANLRQTLGKPQANSGKHWANLGQNLGQTSGKPQAKPQANLICGKYYAQLHEMTFFYLCVFKIKNMQVIQNDVIKCCKMMSSNVAKWCHQMLHCCIATTVMLYIYSSQQSVKI